MKRRILIGLGTLVLLAAIAAPSYMWYTARAGQATAVDKAKADIQSQFLQAAFIGKYGGENVKLLGVNESKDFIFYWQDAEKQYASVYVGGKWLELGSAPIPAATPAP